ncbi:GNAT family N-acetyltransferase [Pendulispora brunnea]|uniref:GNAT family N-acetyltransferase n=1 Tax=Pendulispora brunnea TaxID=2905690 RepID=A0ABZ2KLL7_9BACT
MIRSGATFRSATPSDLDRIVELLTADPACTVTKDSYRANLETGEYRLEWTWLAESAEGDLLAVAIWWGPRSESKAPSALDGFYAIPSFTRESRIELSAALLAAAHEAFGEAPEYHVFVPANWRDAPAVVESLAWRQEAARRAGLTHVIERLRYEWTSESPLPPRDGRLIFRPEPDDEVFVDLFIRTLEGTLDAASAANKVILGAEAQARGDIHFLKEQMLGQRDWWRVATDENGAVVGFGIPSRNSDFHVVGYLGVLPEYRGRGHADRILAEITRLLVEQVGAAVIRADTDLGNRPMAKAFARLGYHNFACRLVHSAAHTV